MKPSKFIIFSLLIYLLSSPSFSETIDDLVRRDGKFYLKFSEELFSGNLKERFREHSGTVSGKVNISDIGILVS